MKWPRILYLAVIILLGTALRAYQIGEQSLWFDELLSVTISGLDLTDTLRISGAIDPPLYYLLLHFWLGLGREDGLVRVLSLIPAVATIPGIFIPAKQLFGTTVGFIAALIFALAPLQVFYAQEARMYSLLILFSTLSMWAYHRAQTLGRKRDWAVWVILTLLAMYAHIFAGVLLAALNLDALWRWHRKQASLQPVVAANASIVPALVPWMMLLLPNFGYLIGILWLAPPTVFHPIMTLVSFVFGPSLAFPSNAIGLTVVVATLGFMLPSVWRAFKARAQNNPDAKRLIVLAAFFPLIFTFAISQIRSVYLDRWLLESSTAFYILLAWGIVCSDRRKVLRVLALSCVPLLLALFNYYFQADYAKPPYRQAIAKVHLERGSATTTLHTSSSSFLAGRHYDFKNEHILLYHPAEQWLSPSIMRDLRAP